MRQMAGWTDEFRRSWQGISQPSLPLGLAFAGFCLALATAARWGLALIRPELAFAPYFPAVLFATAFGGFRIGLATLAAGGLLGIVMTFGEAPPDSTRTALLLIYVMVSALLIWGADHYRSIASHHRAI